VKGEHVVRHILAILIEIWSNMYIETTFLGYGYTQGGIIDVTLEPETLKTWTSGLVDMVETKSENLQTSHYMCILVGE